VHEKASAYMDVT